MRETLAPVSIKSLNLLLDLEFDDSISMKFKLLFEIRIFSSRTPKLGISAVPKGCSPLDSFCSLNELRKVFVTIVARIIFFINIVLSFSTFVN